MKKRILILLSLLSICFSGCSSWRPVEDKADYKCFFLCGRTGAGSVYDAVATDGSIIIYMEPTEAPGKENRLRLTAVNLKDGTTQAVCWNPGCTHQPGENPDCPALFPYRSAVLAYDADRILVLEDSYSVEQSGQQYMDREVVSITEVNLETRERKLLCSQEMDYQDSYAYLMEAVLFQNKLYCSWPVAVYQDRHSRAVRKWIRRVVEWDLTADKLTELYRVESDLETAIFISGVGRDGITWHLLVYGEYIDGAASPVSDELMYYSFKENKEIGSGRGSLRGKAQLSITDHFWYAMSMMVSANYISRT